jgi:hypothetical protein
MGGRAAVPGVDQAREKPASPDRHSASAVNPRQPIQRAGLPPLLTIYKLVEPVSALRRSAVATPSGGQPSALVEDGGAGNRPCLAQQGNLALHPGRSQPAPDGAPHIMVSTLKPIFDSVKRYIPDLQRLTKTPIGLGTTF